jgi:hypothetical protein
MTSDTTTPATAWGGETAPQLLAAIVQRDDGRYQIGLTDDAPGPFESRAFAVAIARRDHAASA